MAQNTKNPRDTAGNTVLEEKQAATTSGDVSPGVSNDASGSPYRRLDDTYAAQLGEWITSKTVTLGGWDSDPIRGIAQHPHTLAREQRILLGKLVYDACMQFQQQGHFPVDVSMFDRAAEKAATTHSGQSGGIVNQYGEDLGGLGEKTEGP